jgi:hypothetical protein
MNDKIQCTLDCEICIGFNQYQNKCTSHFFDDKVTIPLNSEYLSIKYCKIRHYGVSLTESQLNTINITSYNKVHMSKLKLLKKVDFKIEPDSDYSNPYNWLKEDFDFEVFNNGLFESLTITTYPYPENILNSIQKISTLKELIFIQFFKYHGNITRELEIKEKYRLYCLEKNIRLIIK